MRTCCPATRPAVQRLDRSASLRIFSGARQAQRNVCFREAIVDYRLLFEHAGGAQDPLTADCFGRWADNWSTRTLRSVTPKDVSEYFAELAARGHPGREVRREKRLFSGFHRWARRCGWVDDDATPGTVTDRPRLRRPAAVWTASEQRRLLEACRGPLSRHAGEASRESLAQPFLHPLVLLGLRTGLPVGAILDLEWRHVDLEKERIVIPAREAPDGRPIDAPMAYDVRGLLAALRRRARGLRPTPRRVLETVRIPTANGRPDRVEVLAAFRRARRLAGVPVGDFHSLGMAFLRNCASAGVPREHAALMCHWADRRLLLEAYG